MEQNTQTSDNQINNEFNFPYPILLFDGVCNFCNSSVNFVFDRDASKSIHYASLQSNFGQKLLDFNKMNKHEFDSIIFLENGKIYQKSAAIFKILKYLGKWKFLMIFRIFPDFFLNIFYSFIAKRRYLIFGKKNECRMPSKEMKSLFIEN